MSDSTVVAAAAEESVSSGALIYVAVLVALYLCFLLGVAVWSWYGTRGQKLNVDHHFTGGGNLGPIVLCCTLFATAFSGYTVVGIPNETYGSGFLGMRWPVMSLTVVLGCVTISSRLREVSVERNYNSPVSFIEDRYKSKGLHRAISLIMAIPMVFYLTAQFAALGSTVVALSQGAVSSFVGQLILAVVMLLYETFGGLKGVAITDVLQGVLLLTGTTAACVVLGSVYGPFEEVWARIITTTRPQWELGPSHGDNLNIASFMASQLAFPIYPHVLQRVVAARSTNVLKLSWAVWIPVTYMAQVPGVFLGIYGADPNFLPNKVAASGYFGAAMDVLLRKNTFTIFTAGLILIGSLAAIMSTADSAILSCSNVVTMDLGKKWIWPAVKGGVMPTDHQVMVMSKVSSIVIVMLAVVATNLNVPLSSLFVLQGALLCQATPAYILGLYHGSMREASLIAGMSVGTIVFIVLQFSGPELRSAVMIGPGFVGLLVNVFVTFAYQMGSVAMGAKDSPLPEGKLDNKEIERIMENNVNEPGKNPVLWFCWVAVWFQVPWFFGSSNPQIGGLIGGAPDWFVWMMLSHGVVSCFAVYVIWKWQPHPPNKKSVEKDMDMQLNAKKMTRETMSMDAGEVAM